MPDPTHEPTDKTVADDVTHQQAGKRHQWEQTFTRGAASLIFEPNFPATLPDGSVIVRAPSGKKMTIFKSEGTGADMKHFVELWSRNRLEQRLAVSAVHGAHCVGVRKLQILLSLDPTAVVA
jgi:hypothetical protein